MLATSTPYTLSIWPSPPRVWVVWRIHQAGYRPVCGCYSSPCFARYWAASLLGELIVMIVVYAWTVGWIQQSKESAKPNQPPIIIIMNTPPSLKCKGWQMRWKLSCDDAVADAADADAILKEHALCWHVCMYVCMHVDTVFCAILYVCDPVRSEQWPFIIVVFAYMFMLMFISLTLPYLTLK